MITIFLKLPSPITFKSQQNYVKFRLSNFFLFFSKMKINMSQTTFNEGVSILPAGKSHYSMILFVRFKDQLFLFFQLLLLYFHYFHCKWSYWSCFAVCLKITKGKKKVQKFKTEKQRNKKSILKDFTECLPRISCLKALK